MVPRTLLVAARPFGERLSAAQVAAAIAGGLQAGGRQSDLCPIAIADERAGDVRALLDSLGFDARMRAARAVILAEPRLAEETLAGTVAFEIATRARQGGVPAYAITRENLLDSFDARILDLQAILEARGASSLQSAGHKLADFV
jgi:glycerate 2-kinase